MVTLTKSAQKLKEKFIEEGIEKGIEEGIEEGIKKVSSAMAMIKNGSSIEDISIATGLSKDQINQLYDFN